MFWDPPAIAEKVNQLWIDKEKLVAVRYFKYDANGFKEGGHL
jgi:hypothetical protein